MTFDTIWLLIDYVALCGKEKPMQGLFSVHPLFWVRDIIWLCVGMLSRMWIRVWVRVCCVCVCLWAWASTLSVVIHKVTVQMFQGSKNVESPGLLLESGNMHTHNTNTHRMTLLALLSSWGYTSIHPSIHFPYPLILFRLAGIEVYPSMHWATGGLHPGHVPSVVTQPHSEFLIRLTCISCIFFLKFLRTTISSSLKWDDNSIGIIKKAHQKFKGLGCPERGCCSSTDLW